MTALQTEAVDPGESPDGAPKKGLVVELLYLAAEALPPLCVEPASAA